MDEISIETLKEIRYIVLMECISNNKVVMKWGRCTTEEDIQMFIDIYKGNYPNAHYEVYDARWLKSIDENGVAKEG